MVRLPTVDVAASIVMREDGRVLLAERSARQIGAGFWELPGGKIDPGESPAEAAARELEEEIGIHCLDLKPWIRYEHAFRTRRVRLQFFRVGRFTGSPEGREGQRIAWVDPQHIDVGPILPSNERVLLGLGLPSRYAVLTAAGGGADLERLRQPLEAGVRLIQLRAAASTPDQRVLLARRADGLARQFGASVLLAATALEARRAGVLGTHATAADLRRAGTRPDVRLWIASCHGAEDLERAIATGADAAVLSPVLASAAHPERAPLGWEGLKRLAHGAPIPIYAQGGMHASMLDTARAAGALGVAFAA
jgi:8-oxo-dGTP diphosphatase